MAITRDVSFGWKVVLVIAQGEKNLIVLTFVAENQTSFDKHLPEWKNVLESTSIR